MCDELSPRYDVLLKNVLLFSGKNRRIAEIDVLGIAGDQRDVFEVKCSYRFTKAKKQLSRIRRLLRPSVRDAYFYCGEADALVKV